MPSDYAGNTLGTARGLNINANPQTFRDWVGPLDRNDYYRFNLSGCSSFDLSLNGLSANADVQLLNSSGRVITSSTRSGTTAESIVTNLDAGTYYVRVYPQSGSTHYNLKLSARLIDAYEYNDTLNRAYNLGSLSTRSLSASIGGSDANDYYKFSVSTHSNFNLTMNGLSSNADVRLLNSLGNIIRSSSNSGTTAESMSNVSLDAGTYYVQVYPAVGSTKYNLSLSATKSSGFSAFNVFDASFDNTKNTVFQGGAIRFSYNWSDVASLSSVRLEVLKNSSLVSTLGTWTGTTLSDALINLANFTSITGGDYQFRAVARTNTGEDIFSTAQAMKILSWNPSANTAYGTFAADTLNYSGAVGTGQVVIGRGGTDTLNLTGVSSSSVTSINGINLSSFNPTSSTNQAIFRGTALDYLTLADGREIYFQGIENLRFADGSSLELQVRTNDTHYGAQWNLRVSDVDSAWRFSRGASNVLLVSLDTGILTAPGGSGGITDIDTNRLITDPTDDDNFYDYGHGHSATSVMASTANNGTGIAGINWNSNVYSTDVYGGNRVTLQQAITDAIAYARARNQRVVFQGGIQGDFWLNDGGTQAQLEQLIQANSDIAVFAVAAGNGGPGGNLDDPNYLTSVSGVAKLQTTHSNVISVGALQNTNQTTVNGLANAGSVNIASYSNRGSNLTLMAATDSPAMTKFGDMHYFSGTSCANPNMAGIASLVWSVNSGLNAGQLRQILIDTAMDLGASGRDNTFGNGLVNADAAVRRALALNRNSQLANLYSGRSEFA